MTALVIWIRSLDMRKVAFALGIFAAVAHGVVSGQVPLDHLFPDAWHPYIIAWLGVYLYVFPLIIGAHGATALPWAKDDASPKPGMPKIPTAAVVAFAVIAAALALAAPAHAQTRALRPVEPAVARPAAVQPFHLPQFQLPCDPLKLIPNCKAEDGASGPTQQSAEGFSGLLQEIYDKIHTGGEAVIADMTKAQGVASQKFPDGTMADAPSNQCLTAVIPVAQLIVNNQIVPAGVTAAPTTVQPAAPGSATTAPAPPATPDGLVTIFVKTRVIVNALQNPTVQSGCAWLQSSINQAGTSGLANVLAGLVGLTKLGVAIPGVAL